MALLSSVWLSNYTNTASYPFPQPHQLGQKFSAILLSLPLMSPEPKLLPRRRPWDPYGKPTRNPGPVHWLPVPLLP